MKTVMKIALAILLIAIFHIPSNDCFRIRSLPKYDRSSSKIWSSDENSNTNNILMNTNNNNKKVIVEITTKTEIIAASTASSTSSTAASKSRKNRRTGVYKEQKETIAEKITDSPLNIILTIMFNPTTLVLAIYLSSIGWSKVLWVQKFLSMFGKGSSVDGKKTVDKSEEVKFQTYECEECGMELRPAKGRAKAIFARPTFRCQKCGAKASSYFDIDDLSDPRAVARLERLEKEKLEEDDNRADVDDEE